MSLLLERTLWANALFSGGCGLTVVVAGGWVADLLGQASPWLVRGVGLGLVLFAVVVASQARAPQPALVRAIVAMDAGWVVGSLVLVLLDPGWLSGTGAWLVTAVAALVAALVVLQAVGLGWGRSGVRRAT